MHVAMSPPFGAMKIARSVAASGRYDEWPSPFPAPSLRELSSESETEGVYYDEWRNAPFVGAMKIARSVAVSGRCDEWYSRSRLPL